MIILYYIYTYTEECNHVSLLYTCQTYIWIYVQFIAHNLRKRKHLSADQVSFRIVICQIY